MEEEGATFRRERKQNKEDGDCAYTERDEMI